MDFQSLTALYAQKSDEELLILASAFSQLTPEAQSALRGEIGKRRLRVENVALPAAPAPQPKARDFRATEPAVDVPVGEFIEEVWRLFHKRRWSFIKIAFPAVLISYLVVTFTRMETRSITRNMDPSSMHSLNATLLQVRMISSVGWLVSWMVFCAAFAAICSAVDQDRAGLGVSLSESFGVVAERLGPFLRLSLLLLFVFFTLEVLLGALGLTGTLWLVKKAFGNISPFVISSCIWLLAALPVLVLCRFALAMPALVLDDHPVMKSILRSDELTEGKWLILGVLLFKSVAGGYIAAMLPFWLAGWISIGLHSWFQWVLVAASIAAVTVVEPIMFIGFALLYEKTSRRSNGALPEPAAQAAFPA